MVEIERSQHSKMENQAILFIYSLSRHRPRQSEGQSLKSLHLSLFTCFFQSNKFKLERRFISVVRNDDSSVFFIHAKALSADKFGET